MLATLARLHATRRTRSLILTSLSSRMPKRASSAGASPAASKKQKTTKAKGKGKGKGKTDAKAVGETLQIVDPSDFGDGSLAGKVKLMSWNVNGFRAMARKGEAHVKSFLEENSPDVLCINETKMDKSLCSQAEWKQWLGDQGYVSFWACAEKKGYSGVAAFCKKRCVCLFPPRLLNVAPWCPRLCSLACVQLTG